jgi:uncharacterized protein (DUF58 family)
MSVRATEVQPLLDAREIAQIELYILRRVKEIAAGDHMSLSTGTGFDLTGLKDWEPGDAVSSIDWAQSSLTNFSPIVTRQFEQDSSATVVAIADASLSTRCGTRQAAIMTAIARALAAVGLAAAFFQDRFGLIAFGDGLRLRTAARPRIGKSHVVHCLSLYADAFHAPAEDAGGADALTAVAGHLRGTSMLAVISDFLFADVERAIAELARLNTVHDVFLMMVDARFVYELPPTSAGWIEVCDAESGATRLISRAELAKLPARVEEWQGHVARLAREAGLDIVRTGLDRWEMENTLLNLVTQRRVRKVAH